MAVLCSEPVAMKQYGS